VPQAPPVNLYSDTQTRPSEAMRAAMASAEVGDEQKGEDPTTSELERRVAALLGKEAAVFLPSGTMCNEIAIRIHVRPGGDEAFIARHSHPIEAEAGGPAAVSGAVLTVLDGDRGTFTGETLDAAVRAHSHDSRYTPRPRLVCVEQTANLAGGTVWPLERMRDVLDVARAHDLRAHLDGARLLNAVIASGVDAPDWAAGFDSAWIDFSKGLGAPVGACLAGSRGLRRGGVALEADARGRDEAVGDPGRGGALRPRSQRRAPRRRPWARPPLGGRPCRRSGDRNRP
jgi:threonine aldolase